MESRNKAFTLFEILVVLLVMVVIAGMAYLSLAKSSGDRALERGAEMLHSMVRVARTQAIMNGTYARLIINADSGDPEAYLRKVGVMIRDDQKDDFWYAVERGGFLPEGVFLVPQSGSVELPAGLPKSIYKSDNGDSALDTAVFDYQYPLKASVSEKVESDPDWICIQFAPNGRLSSISYHGGGLVPLSNQLILAKGNWAGDTVVFSEAERFVGIAFKRSGSTYRSEESGLFEYAEGEGEDEST